MDARRKAPQIFSRNRRIAAIGRSRRRQQRENAASYILDDMVDDVLDRLDFMRFTARTALIVGDWTGALGRSLRTRGTVVNEQDVSVLDEEKPLPGGPYDLIVSLASLDRVNDVPGALVHAKQGLAKDGIFIAALVGAGSLQNLRRAMIAAEPDRPAARMHPLIDTPSASALMQRAGFRRQVVDSHSLKVSYGSFWRLVSDLRDQGLGNALYDRAPVLSRVAARQAEKTFAAAANAEDRVEETFEILSLTGWNT